MPQVPRRRLTTVQERGITDVRSNVQVSGDTFGGGQSLAAGQRGQQDLQQGLNRLAAAEQQAYLQEKDRANKLRILEEKRAFDDWEKVSIYDPKSGVINLKGKDAYGVPDNLNKNFDSFVQEREKSLSNDEQKFLFRQMVEARRSNINNWAMTHVTREIDKAEKAEFKANIESSKERARLDPMNIPVELQAIKDRIEDLADADGMDSESKKQLMQQHTTDFHKRILQTIMDSDAVGSKKNAERYFNEVKGEIDPDEQKKIVDYIKKGKIDEEAQTYVDSAISKGMTQTDFVRSLSKIKDPELRKATRNAGLQMYSDIEAADNADDNNLYEELYNKMEQNPGKRPQDLVTFTQWQDLKPAIKDALIKRSTKTAASHDMELYNKFLQDDDLGSLSQYEYEKKYFSKFGKFQGTDFRSRADSIYKEAKKLNKSGGGGLSGKFSFGKEVSNFLEINGKLNDKNAAIFEYRLNEQVSILEAQKGGKTTPAERQEIMNRLITTQVMRDDYVIDDKTAIGLIKPTKYGNDEDYYYPIEKMTKIEIDTYINEFKAIGINITKDQIQKLHAATVIGDKEMRSKILKEIKEGK